MCAPCQARKAVNMAKSIPAAPSQAVLKSKAPGLTPQQRYQQQVQQFQISNRKPIINKK